MKRKKEASRAKARTRAAEASSSRTPRGRLSRKLSRWCGPLPGAGFRG
jgi:hypothetical protein